MFHEIGTFLSLSSCIWARILSTTGYDRQRWIKTDSDVCWSVNSSLYDATRRKPWSLSMQCLSTSYRFFIILCCLSTAVGKKSLRKNAQIMASQFLLTFNNHCCPVMPGTVGYRQALLGSAAAKLKLLMDQSEHYTDGQ